MEKNGTYGTISYGTATKPAPSDITRMVEDGFALQQKIKHLTEELDQIKTGLIQTLGAGVSVRAGNSTCTISEAQTTTISDPGRLMDLLDERFHDLVDQNTTYKPTSKLLALAGSDQEVAPVIRECIETRTSTRVAWRAAAK